MGASKYVPEKTLVEWFFNPNNIKETKKPKKPADHPVETLEASINLTMRYLTASQAPFTRTRRHARTVQGPDGTLTLFWSIFERREDNRVVTKEGTKTEIRITYYGFDAARRLMVETVVSHSWEDIYRSGYAWLNEEEIPAKDRQKLMQKLLELRKKLAG